MDRRPGVAARQDRARQLQLQALTDMPHVPLGQNFDDTAYRPDISGMPTGFVMFRGARRT